jgi:hypothetical protein
MARRASYSYERAQRDRAKVEKREAKRSARSARKAGSDGDQPLAPEASPTREPNTVIPPSASNAATVAEDRSPAALTAPETSPVDATERTPLAHARLSVNSFLP